jgi:hydrogenase expression/formation protein HypD
MIRHLDEYRDEALVRGLLDRIRQTVKRDWHIMEICGGQTHSLVKNGLIELLPDNITMIHGPGCPVCVTPESMIDAAIDLCLEKGVILCTYGDMIRVPGKTTSLMAAKSRGGDVRIVYSPLDALNLAVSEPDRDVVFLAVGFETTAPAHALAVLQAEKSAIQNFSILHSHVLVPPAMRAILDDPDCRVDAFLAAGHVCAITGMRDYGSISAQYEVPIVATGFEPVDLLQGILECVEQLEKQEFRVEIRYARAVREGGNTQATLMVDQVFERADKEWRGLGVIPESGLGIRQHYQAWDAFHKFGLTIQPAAETACIAGEILKGVKKPHECPYFGKACTPVTPKGAPMVSSEGACAAYYHFHATET